MMHGMAETWLTGIKSTKHEVTGAASRNVGTAQATVVH